jgi:hypothetical protein
MSFYNFDVTGFPNPQEWPGGDRFRLLFEWIVNIYFRASEKLKDSGFDQQNTEISADNDLWPVSRSSEFFQVHRKFP